MSHSHTAFMPSRTFVCFPCVKKMNINYLILPQATPQLYILTPASFDFWVTFCGPFLESKV